MNAKRSPQLGLNTSRSPLTSSSVCIKLSVSSSSVLWDRSGTGRKPYVSLLHTNIWTSVESGDVKHSQRRVFRYQRWTVTYPPSERRRRTR